MSSLGVFVLRTISDSGLSQIKQKIIIPNILSRFANISINNLISSFAS